MPRGLYALGESMLEKLPEAIGRALRGQRAGLERTAFHAVDLRAGMAAISVSSLAFADHAPIPERYTADGAGVSPPLQWRGVPKAAAALALIIEDADSPTPQPLVLGIVVDLPPGDGAMPEGGFPNADEEVGACRPGLNSYLQAGWLPPDPPPGHGRHRYVFQVFALEAGATLVETPGRDALLETIGRHGLASGCLVGTYERADASIAAGAGEQVPSTASSTA
jgi:Raf kinase inhibitor-like YbhB/YbcL family protein